MTALTPTGSRRPSALRMIERNLIAWRRNWWVIATGVVEPFLYLMGLGLGMGALVGDVEVRGEAVEYATYIAPGLMASSAMTGSLFDTTFNFFYKLKFTRAYEGILHTPMGLGNIVSGEMGWAVMRGGIYSVFFVVMMVALGLVQSAWFVLSLPAALLVGWAFAAFGTSLTTFVRSWTDFDLMALITQPLFLASTTFFPMSVYPDWAHTIVRATPLYHGVDLIRALSLGTVGLTDFGHVAYLAVMGTICTAFTSRRLQRSLLS